MKCIVFLILTVSLFTNITGQVNTWEVYLRGQAVKSIDFDNNYIWAATDSFLVSLNRLDKSVNYYPYPDIIEDMRSILKIDKNGVIWIVRSKITDLNLKNSIYGFDDNKWVKIEFNKDGLIYSLAVDKKNNKWITAGAFRPYLYRMAEESFMQYTPENSGLFHDYVFKVTSDNEGNIWLTNHGPSIHPGFAVSNVIMKYDGNSWNSYSSEAGYYTSVNFDGQENLWIQYHNSSANVDLLRKLDTISNSWSEQITLSENYILEAIEGENRFWFGTYSRGIALYNGSDWSFYTTLNSELPSDTVYQIAIDSDGTKWIGTAEGLVAFKEKGVISSVGSDAKIMNKIVLFPNPAHDYLIISLSNELQNTTAEILDIHGKFIQSFNMTKNQIRVDISNYPTGIYLVRMRSEENQILKKFVKQ